MAVPPLKEGVKVTPAPYKGLAVETVSELATGAATTFTGALVATDPFALDCAVMVTCWGTEGAAQVIVSVP
jgi:hypothetical protein